MLRIFARYLYGITRNLVELNRKLLQELATDLVTQFDEDSQAFFHAVL